jgi:hypothetical protein
VTVLPKAFGMQVSRLLRVSDGGRELTLGAIIGACGGQPKPRLSALVYQTATAVVVGIQGPPTGGRLTSRAPEFAALLTAPGLGQYTATSAGKTRTAANPHLETGTRRRMVSHGIYTAHGARADITAVQPARPAARLRLQPVSKLGQRRPSGRRPAAAAPAPIGIDAGCRRILDRGLRVPWRTISPSIGRW